ncbi:MAG: chain length determinant protein [Candidatus Contendobacter sp.]|nr:chain length determinant protein [Gammaproteobacteria bacterium]MCC8992429.1 chain length determinant protein [Candidatus Contendobacter sp.]
MTSASLEPQPLPPSGTFKPLVSIRRHKWLALALITVIIVIGAPLVLKTSKPVYETKASIYVAQRFAKVLKSDQELEFGSTTQYQQYVEQQIRNIVRYDVAVKALHQLGPYRSLWQKPDQTDRSAAQKLIAALNATAVKGTFLISVTLTGSQAEGLAESLNSYLHTYLEIAKKEDLFASDERIEQLRERQAALNQTVAEKAARRTVLAELLGISGFDDKAQNPYERSQQEIANALGAAIQRRIVADVALRAYDETQNRDARAALDAAAAQIVTGDSGLNSLKNHLWARRGALLDEISGLAPQHPLRAVAERKLKDMEKEVKDSTDALINSTRRQLLEQRRTALREAREIEQALLAEQQRLQERNNWFTSNYGEGVALTQEINRANAQLDTINERMDFLILESAAPGFLRLQSQALTPEYPVGGGPKKLLALVVVAAFGLGLSVPIAIDFLDPRIKTVAQVHRLLGFAPFAALLDQRDQRNRLVRIDQLRRLVLSLGRERRQHGVRRIALTSVKTGSGVTDLLFDLAQEFAHDGLRVIVVEANALNPDDRYVESALGAGLIDLLHGEATLDEVIAPARDALPDRISVGLAVQRHLPFYDRFAQALDPLLGRYDLVLLDAPPVLLSVDTEFLARYADALLLLVGARQALPGELKRSARLLEKADPRLFGVIVNRLQAYQGGGYYDEVIKKYEASEAAASRSLQARLESAGSEKAAPKASGASSWGQRLRRLVRRT